MQRVLYLFILIISLLSNIFFICSEVIGENSDDENFDINTFYEKESNEIATEALQLNPFEKVMDMKSDTILINSLIEDPYNIILIISDNSCSTCINESLRILSKIVSHFNPQNIIVLGLYENKRDFFLLSKNYPFRFFLLNETSALKGIALKSPLFFTLDFDYKIRHPFLPIVKYPKLSEKYLNQVVEKFKN